MTQIDFNEKMIMQQSQYYIPLIGHNFKLLATIVFLILSFALTSCFDMFGEPRTALIKASSNYNKTKKAVLLQENGDATIDLSLQVSILDFDTKLSETEIGNTLTVDRNHGATGLDSTSINFRWLSNDTLQIDFDQKLRTFIQEKKTNGVTVMYKLR